MDVEGDDIREGRAGIRDPERDIARAARNIEMPEARFLRRPDFARENVLPDPVESAGHQIVHEVVAEGDLVEDLIDPRLLFFERDAGKTEMCLLCHDLMQAGTASALAGAP